VVYTSANPDIQGYRKQEAVLAENTYQNKWWYMEIIDINTVVETF
jgi:hypothetical protein